jgi:hypothetical protein
LFSRLLKTGLIQIYFMKPIVNAVIFTGLFFIAQLSTAMQKVVSGIRIIKLITGCGLFALVVLQTKVSYAQGDPSKNVSSIIAAVDNFNHQFPVEKLYLQLDKPCYTTQDTIWLKAYLFDNATHHYSPLSGLLYVELINDSSKVVQRISLRVSYGLSLGQIDLTALPLTEGSYTLRAYTNWMQNFGPAYFFNKRIYIGNISQNLLVTESHTLTDKDGKRNLKLLLQFSQPDKQPFMEHDMQLKIMAKKRTLFKGAFTTNLDGIIESNFTLPEQEDDSFTIIAEDKRDSKNKAVIPVIINNTQYTDVQFMPEGGHLVAGLTSCVGFKALADDGLATDVQGTIVNSKNEQAATFKSLHKGMGFFDFTPAAGETYKAIVDLPGGKKKEYPLPPIQNSGMVLHVVNDDAKDSLLLTIHASQALITGQMYHLLGLSRGVVCYAANFSVTKREIEINIAKKLFPSGILHFTIFNSERIPVIERLTFINHNDNLNIALNTDKPHYALHDSIPLHIKVTDKDGKPVSASFSLAVTNDGQIKADSASNILTNIFLTSDLQGFVEDPAYYFDAADPLSAKALDNLLLTQGWVDYKWENILKPLKAPLFTAEPEFMVSGTVTGLVNQPVKNAKVTLISTGKYTIHRDTLSNAAGKFTFRNFPITDTVGFVLQTVSARGKSFGMGITANEFMPAPVAANYQVPVVPWYVNSDTISLNYIRNNIARQKELDRKLNFGGSKMLKVVQITDQKIIKGSYNLNGPGQADQILDEQDIAKENKITLLDLLYKRIKGFHIGIFPPGSKRLSFDIYTKEVNILMDGVEVGQSLGMDNIVLPPAPDNYPGGKLEYLTNFLKQYTAEDIKGIEVMYNTKFNNNYNVTFLTPEMLLDWRIPITIDWAYIEITTKSGHGIYSKKTPGVITYKPLPITRPKQFYKPKYTVKTSVGTTDLRSTIDWEPNIITNNRGEAKVSFYAGGQYSDYTLIMQGADMFGSLGFKTMKIKIAK